MLKGLNVNNRGPLGLGTVEIVAAKRFEMIRSPGTDDNPPFAQFPIPVLQRLVSEILEGGCEPMVILRDATAVRELPNGIYVNYANEPDLKKFGWTVKTFLRGLDAMVTACDGHCHLAIPGISNLNRRGFDFVKQIPWRDIPPWVIADFHLYPDGDDPIRTNRRERLFLGPDARDQELRHFRSLVGATRPIGCGEVGYHLAHGLTEERQAAHMRCERELLERHRCVYACAFQINDGPLGNRDTDGNYGLRRHDGTWKPAAEAWTT